jgi:hypothetical protein
MPKHVCILLTKLKDSIMLGPSSTIIPSQVYATPFSPISSAEHRGRACISNFFVIKNPRSTYQPQDQLP